MSRVVVTGPSLYEIVEDITADIQQEMESRTYRASNELRNAALLVLRGQRSGRRYKVPGTKKYYTASAPGEPPAVRTGTFRNSWQPNPRFSGAFGVYWARIESDLRTDNGKYTLGEILENGTPGGKIAPRPHHDRILAKAEPMIVKIYDEPYNTK